METKNRPFVRTGAFLQDENVVFTSVYVQQVGRSKQSKSTIIDLVITRGQR
jgi:hypothetical protein